jgi:SAM-dependent methyltransferase
MKEKIKNILKWLDVYYSVQGFYRNLVNNITKTRYRWQYSTYKGEGYLCNYCGSSYSKFAPWHPSADNKKAIEKNNLVAGYGENIICPHCLSTARERLLKAMIETHVSISGKKILHISPETFFFNFIKKKAEVITVDYLPGFYKRIDPGIQFADATRLSFADNEFDMVIGNHIMEHIPADLVAMKEIYRVLKTGGIAILQVPFSISIPSTIEEPGIDDTKRQSDLFGQKDHVRIYALNDYLLRLRIAGFTVVYIAYESLQEFYNYAIQKGEGFISIEK